MKNSYIHFAAISSVAHIRIFPLHFSRPKLRLRWKAIAWTAEQITRNQEPRRIFPLVARLWKTRLTYSRKSRTIILFIPRMEKPKAEPRRIFPLHLKRRNHRLTYSQKARTIILFIPQTEKPKAEPRRIFQRDSRGTDRKSILIPPPIPAARHTKEPVYFRMFLLPHNLPKFRQRLK